jgi:putative ABC transport system permease protein
VRLLTIAQKDLTRRKLRSTLAILGLAIAVATVVALMGVANGLERSFLDLYNQRGADLVVQHKGGTMQLNSGIEEDLGPRIEKLPGAGQVIGGLMDVVAMEQFDLFAVIVNGWAPDCVVLDRVTIMSGRRLEAGDTGRVMLGQVLAGNIGKRVGDTLEMYGEPQEIVGIFDSFSVYEAGGIFMLLTDMQRLMDRPKQVTGYVVQAEPKGDPQAITRLANEIDALSPTIHAEPVPTFVHNISQIRVVRAGAWATSAIAVTVGVIGVLNTMMMSVFERAREIGTLRALGWRKGRVMFLVLLESLLLCAVGAVAGVALGVATMHVLGYWPKLAGFVEGGPPMRVVVESCLMAVAIGTLGAAYPACWAANLRPVDALRGPLN